MYRVLTIATIVVASLAARAQAIEMFTNFHNGENIGFPPMQVPIGVYGGWGRGGWNPVAEGMPLKSLPPTPSMMPTGQIPGGFRRFRAGPWNGGGANFDGGTNVHGEGAGVSGPSASSNEAGTNSPMMQSLSDRRRGRWQLPERISPNGGKQATTSRLNSTNSTEQADSAMQSAESTPTKPATTYLEAKEGTAPSFDLSEPGASSSFVPAPPVPGSLQN